MKESFLQDFKSFPDTGKKYNQTISALSKTFENFSTNLRFCSLKVALVDGFITCFELPLFPYYLPLLYARIISSLYVSLIRYRSLIGYLIPPFIFRIVGLYTTFVFLVSRLIRGLFDDLSFKVIYTQMPNVDKVLQLALDIYLVRESREFTLEEDLYGKLLFLYRSPETLVKWTKQIEEDQFAKQNANRPTQGE